MRWQEGSIPLADVVPKSVWPIRTKRMGVAHRQKQQIPCERRYSSDGKLGELLKMASILNKGPAL